MNGRERLLTMLEGGTPDSLPLMPITMMYAADHVGVKYGPYATDHRILVDAQVAIAEAYDFDFVSCISDPAREAADCGAHVEIFDDQPPAIIETDALLADKAALATLEMPDPGHVGKDVGPRRRSRIVQTAGGRQQVDRGLDRGPVCRSRRSAWH